jgi:hypothetical protein
LLTVFVEELYTGQWRDKLIEPLRWVIDCILYEVENHGK